ncbi:MAG TPA: hypothetical protein VGQ72_04390 [Pyrinomonadaceae bacterium]|nr:hypothetical protein [Pyrinomonadaceae bacterium]
MRWINRAIALGALLTLSAVAAWAQSPECTDEFKTATYSKWYDNRDKDQAAAYEAAKEYLNVCPTDDSPYATALKNFKKKYEDLVLNKKLASDFETAVKNKNYADQIRLGKQLTGTAANGDNAVIYIVMAGAGLGDPNQLAESAAAAKKAIELIEAGKPFTPAYQTKDQALAAMNYVIAKSMMKTSPTESIPYFIKAGKYESDLKKSPQFYNELATAYGEGPVDKFARDYKALAEAGKSVDSPEAKLVVANLNQALDRQIDAFARAAAVSTAPADKKAFMDALALVYKDRNKTDANPTQLNDMVASALSKPLPDAPTPITTLPTTTPSTTPGGTSATPGSSAGSTGAAPGNGAGATSTRPSSTTPTTSSSKPATSGTTTPAKPTASPTPKPRQRRANHRGR